LDEETQLKVTGSTPVKTDCDLPDHVNVLFVKTLEDVELPSETTTGLKQLLFDHRETFATSSADLGFCPLVQHDIDTGDARPIKQSPRRPPISAMDAEDKSLDEMLETGVIEPSNSSWASPVCLVKKKDGSFRFCIDYRRVNAVSKKDAYPIPDIQDVLDNLRGSTCFCSLRAMYDGFFSHFGLLRQFIKWLLVVGDDPPCKRKVSFLHQAWSFSIYPPAFWPLRGAWLILSPYGVLASRPPVANLYVLP